MTPCEASINDMQLLQCFRFPHCLTVSTLESQYEGQASVVCPSILGLLAGRAVERSRGGPCSVARADTLPGPDSTLSALTAPPGMARERAGGRNKPAAHFSALQPFRSRSRSRSGSGSGSRRRHYD